MKYLIEVLFRTEINFDTVNTMDKSEFYYEKWTWNISTKYLKMYDICSIKSSTPY